MATADENAHGVQGRGHERTIFPETEPARVREIHDAERCFADTSSFDATEFLVRAG